MRGLKQVLQKLPSDVVIVSAVRSAITRTKKGGFAQTLPEEMLNQTLKAMIAKSGLDPKVAREVVVGNVCPPLGGHKTNAMAIKDAGFPYTTTVSTVNQQCASSARALAAVAQTIISGSIDCGVAAGVENMTLDYFPSRNIPSRTSPVLMKSKTQEALDVLMPMGLTSENVAREYHISRADQDAFAVASHHKAAAAQAAGRFAEEIVPIQGRQDGEQWVTIDKDDGVRAASSIEKLAKLDPAFSADGTTTAGNSSQISDGASAAVLMRRAKADELGLRPIGKFVASATAGVPARLMGIAPAHAVPALLKLVDMSVAEVDLWELNEAFASQSLYCIQELGLDMEKVNVNGGAIALGHPLGATGTRIVATLLNALQQQDKQVGVLSMCASTGQGFAAMLVRETV